MGGVRASKSGPKPPEIVAPRLGAHLGDAIAEDAIDAELHSDERYVDADFTGLNLTSTSFIGCSFERARLLDTVLRGAQFSDCVLDELDAPTLSAPRSSWRSTTVAGSRIGSGELYESTWRSVVIEGGKINYLNARSAAWRDVAFRDCVIDELDLSYGKISRLVLDGCRIGTLDVSNASLTDVDLRGARLSTVNGLGGLAGAWITETQLFEFAPLLATQLGIHIAV
ncbi:pentapeptide repeat-containing protein [Microlunatus ginsengisoli]|uniref:Pentapeptide repeat-containing protein n=1 Tax=Microlunatus ginsengisoli TaxID=363863 RepID=A0ABP6ZVG0_9ACTN